VVAAGGILFVHHGLALGNGPVMARMLVVIQDDLLVKIIQFHD
jgi:hypothetical protein